MENFLTTLSPGLPSTSQLRNALVLQLGFELVGLGPLEESCLPATEPSPQE